MGKQFFYRGYLTSCNYSCGYCPFSKRKMTEEQRRKDQEALEQFVCQMEAETRKHALQIVPYGEALIHEYYWVAMARFSQIPSEEYIGCQTNLSFPVEKMLSVYEASGGEKQKLRLWCTFHPSMTTVETFVMQCKQLEQNNVVFCVGAVGDTDEIFQIQKLREQLPEHVYVWINQMDGRKRNYTEEDIRRFQEIDPYFKLELMHYPADSSKCRKSVFQEADGSRYYCNLHAAQAGGNNRNLHAAQAGKSNSDIHVVQTGESSRDTHVAQAEDTQCNLYIVQKGEKCHNLSSSQVERGYTDLNCRRRECSCYLAYCNRTDVEELFFFEPYPAFRIPTYPQGIFLDIDGTLVEEGKRALSDAVAEKIRWLAQKSKLYLATALPYPEAMGKCRKIADCLFGGVFADGGHILVWENAEGERRIKWEEVVPLPERISHVFDELFRLDDPCGHRITTSVGCRCYQIKGVVYKQTLFSKRKQGWLPGEAETLVRKMGQNREWEKQFRFHREKKHIGITSAKADKRTGVVKICLKEGIALEDGMAIGNEEEDLPMLSLFPRSLYLGRVSK